MFPSDSGLETQITFESQGQPLPENLPFNILFLGNWSGSENSDFNTQKPVVIDRDNFDGIMSKLNVSIDLTVENNENSKLNLNFTKLDDFHPDSIFRRVPLFSQLKDLRRRLLNENTYNAAAYEVRSWIDGHKNVESPPILDESDLQVNDSQPESSSILDSILNQSELPLNYKSNSSDELSVFLNNIVQPFIIQTDENEQAQLLKVLDDATSNLMSLILHNSKFRKLESAWRGLFLLVRNIETDVDLKIYILDLSKNELTSKLKNSNKLSDSDVYKLIVDNDTFFNGDKSWAIICGNYAFDLNIDDVAALIRISQISQTVNAPFISYVQPDNFNITSFNTDLNSTDPVVDNDSNEGRLWKILRLLPDAGYLSFAMNRFLLRLPYGRDTDPTETFSFEEFIDDSGTENYLFGNPAFICALLLANTYRQFGWEINNKYRSVVTDLPLHIYQKNGETVINPSAEFFMTESILQKIINLGLIPVISSKNTDHLQVGRFQSISLLDGKLSGKWN